MQESSGHCSLLQWCSVGIDLDFSYLEGIYHIYAKSGCCTLIACIIQLSGMEPLMVASYFIFLLDVTVVNMYIIYLDCLANVSRGRALVTSMIHLQIK